MMLAVQSVDGSRAPYREEVTTGSISCHGCTYKMRHEPRPGDIVVLDTGSGSTGHFGFPSRARVKSIQRLNTPNAPTYNVGVELEIAGNIWGISSPPADWFPRQSGNLAESASHGRELRLVARTEPQRALARTEAATTVPVLKNNEAAAVLSPWFANLMNNLSNQVQIAVSEIAAMTLANERKRLLDEFRFQIQNEATGTIEHVITTSKDELARRALKVLNEGAQAIVKNSQGIVAGAIERHIEDAPEHNDSEERTEPVPRHYGDWHGGAGTTQPGNRTQQSNGALRIAAARAGCACDGRSESGPSETGGISDRFQGRIAGNLQASHGPTGK